MQRIIQAQEHQHKDPATGKVIRRLSTPVGVLKIVDVDADSSIGSGL